LIQYISIKILHLFYNFFFQEMLKQFLIIFLLFSFSTFAVNVDSLLVRFKSHKDLKDKYNTVKEICSYYMLTNVDSALLYSKILLDIAQKEKAFEHIADATYLQGVYNKKLRNFDTAFLSYEKALGIWLQLKDSVNVAKSLNAIGVAYLEDGNNKKAIEYLNKAFYLKKLLNDEKGLGITLYNLGNIYLNTAAYDSALYNYYNSIEYFEKINYNIGKASCYNAIGVVNEIMESYDTALVYYQKALEIETELNNYDGMINTYNNIGNIFSMSGMNKLALMYYQNALKYSELSSNSENISNALKNIGLIQTFNSDFKEANSYLTRAVHLAIDVGRKELTVNILHALGYSYTFQEKCDSAVYYLEKSIEIASEINYVDMISKNHSMLAQAYLCLGSGEKAFEHYQKENKINNQIAQQLSNLKLQLISEQKEKQIDQLRMQNELSNAEIQRHKMILISGSIFIFLIIIIITFYARNRILQTKNKTSELKHRVLQLQMNPHFIHNALASIEGYLFVSEPHLTAEYISEFSHLMRNILDNSRQDYISISKEIETLKQYLKLQQFRYKEKFDYEINVNENIDLFDTQIPPMFAQPFVENSIEHGIIHISKKGLIKINFYYYKNDLKISIEDNGVGIKKANELEQKHKQTNSHKPLATKITNERLAIYSRRNKNRYTLNIEDILINNNIEGTRVIISVPYKTS